MVNNFVMGRRICPTSGNLEHQSPTSYVNLWVGESGAWERKGIKFRGKKKEKDKEKKKRSLFDSL